MDLRNCKNIHDAPKQVCQEQKPSQKNKCKNHKLKPNSKLLPNFVSYWDKLPVEIKDEVFKYVTPLTRLANNILKTETLDNKTIKDMWIEAFDVDWQGDLRRIPDPVFCGSEHRLSTLDLCRVKSVQMYKRLCDRFPKSTEHNKLFHEIDKDMEKAVQSKLRSIGPKLNRLLRIHALRLLHVPMSHLWLSHLGLSMDEFPYVRAADCILHGHMKMLIHLVNNNKIDLKWIRFVGQLDKRHGKLVFAMDAAAKNGYLDILKLLHKAGNSCISTDAMDLAATNGHLEVVKFLHENRSEGCSFDAIDSAVENGHEEIAEFLIRNRHEGFDGSALLYCKSQCLAKLLVDSLDEHRARHVYNEVVDKDNDGPAMKLYKKRFGKKFEEWDDDLYDEDWDDAEFLEAWMDDDDDFDDDDV